MSCPSVLLVWRKDRVIPLALSRYEDVYARRFESRKTGKSGYAPACANEWVRGICEKPRVKCAACPHRRFLPVTDDVIAGTFRRATPPASPSLPACIPCSCIVR
jgi:hypothetical protein